MHICVSKLTIIGSGNGLSLDRSQAITWTSAGILLIETLETNFSEILVEIHILSLKMHLKMSSGKLVAILSVVTRHDTGPLSTLLVTLGGMHLIGKFSHKESQ